MYRETISENKDCCTIEIFCDRCSNFTILTGTLGEEFYKQMLVDLGWRVNSSAKKYIHLCPSHAKKEASRQRKLSERLVA